RSFGISAPLPAPVRLGWGASASTSRGSNAMSIAFSCRSCDAPLKVRDELAGRRMRCANCGSSNVVPEADDIDSSADETTTGAPSIRRDEPGMAVFYRWLIVGSIGLTLLPAVTATILIAAPNRIESVEEAPADGGSREINGVVRPFDRIPEPRAVVGKSHRVKLKKDR